MSKQMVQWSFRSIIILMAMTGVACNRGGGSKRPNLQRQEAPTDTQANDKGPRTGKYTGPTEDGKAPTVVPDDGKTPPPAKNSAQTPASAQGSTKPPPILSAPRTSTTGTGPQTVATIPNLTTAPRGSGTTSSTATLSVTSVKAPEEVYIVDRSQILGSSTSTRSASFGPAPAPAQQQAIVYAAPPASSVAHVAPAEVLYKSNAGPGVPATYEVTSGTPKKTGVVDTSGRGFTDSKDDAVMAAIMNRMNQQPAQLRKESEEMAQAVRNVWLGNNNGQLNLNIGFAEGGEKTVGYVEGKDVKLDNEFSLRFVGQLKGRHADLTVLNNNTPYEIRAIVSCVDADNSCRNTVITVEHLQNGQLCRRIYIVHRWYMDGTRDGHFTLSDDDYANWQSRPSAQQRGFLRLIANTVTWNKNFTSQRPQRIDGPMLKYIGIRSWAVAYGPAEAEVAMSKNSKQDAFEAKFMGPLLMGQISGEPTKLAIVTRNQADATQDSKFNESLVGASASLVDNDGRGNLVLEVRFTSGDATRVTFTGLRVPTLSRKNLDQVIPGP